MVSTSADAIGLGCLKREISDGPGNTLIDDILRTCEAIALHWCGDERKWRKIDHLCTTGRFPHFREGTIICARKSVIDRWVALQESYAMQGKKWGPDDVLKHFGPSAGKDIPKDPK
jgi:hypothetical protein